MGGLILENNPEVYIEKIASKKPGLQIVFQTMNLRFRYADHSLQQSLKRIEKSGNPIQSPSTGANSTDNRQIKKLVEEQRNQFENQINCLKQELLEATQDIRQLKAVGMENKLKLEALEGTQKVQEEQTQSQPEPQQEMPQPEAPEEVAAV